MVLMLNDVIRTFFFIAFGLGRPLGEEPVKQLGKV